MAWTFHDVRNDDVSNVIDDVKSQLDLIATSNSEGTLPALAAKVALANRQNGDAFGVVFYDNQITSIPDHPEGRIQFQAKTVRLSGSDPKDLYEQAVDQLNSLSAHQAFWAQVGLTNRLSGDTTLSLYWPEVIP